MKMKRKEYMKKETDHHEGSVMVELRWIEKTYYLSLKDLSMLHIWLSWIECTDSPGLSSKAESIRDSKWCSYMICGKYADIIWTEKAILIIIRKNVSFADVYMNFWFSFQASQNAERQHAVHSDLRSNINKDINEKYNPDNIDTNNHK